MSYSKTYNDIYRAKKIWYYVYYTIKNEKYFNSDCFVILKYKKNVKSFIRQFKKYEKLTIKDTRSSSRQIDAYSFIFPTFSTLKFRIESVVKKDYYNIKF